jgi:predicted CoA-binding protein
MSDTTAPFRFLVHRRLALVGASRDPRDFSRGVLRELLRRGYEVVPVNPGASHMEDRPCYARVQDIPRPVEAALLMTAPGRSADAVRDCLAAGVRAIWFHRGIGPGSVSAEALDLCRAAGVEVVAGECPYMHLPEAGLPHRVHGFFRHLGGSRAA